MRSFVLLISIIISMLFLISCSTGFHGTFTPNTHINEEHADAVLLGPVTGKSCQLRVFYIIPSGPAASTDEAIQSAKEQYEGTKYLIDVSIDDRVEWKFGYSIQCIIVDATAYQ